MATNVVAADNSQFAGAGASPDDGSVGTDGDHDGEEADMTATEAHEVPSGTLDRLRLAGII